MIYSWIAFGVIIFVGNYLMIGSLLIEMSSVTGFLLAGGANAAIGTTRSRIGEIVATACQSIMGVMLVAFVLSWVQSLAEGNVYENPLPWIVGLIATFFPVIQQILNWDREQEFDPWAHRIKLPIALASANSSLITVLMAILMMLIPSFLSLVFWPVLFSAAVVFVATIISIAVTRMRPKWSLVDWRRSPNDNRS